MQNTTDPAGTSPGTTSATSAVASVRAWAELDPSGMSAAATEGISWGVSRARTVIGILGRVGGLLDDLHALRHAAEGIAGELARLSESAAGIEKNSAALATEIVGLSRAAQGIDGHVGHLTTEISSVAEVVPTLQRLTEIVDPLDTTAVRLARLVDRLPGGRRSQHYAAPHHG